jgi:hypothetical protein
MYGIFRFDDTVTRGGGGGFYYTNNDCSERQVARYRVHHCSRQGLVFVHAAYS